jgi:uncharacterized damage-inducible protein DinB
MQACHRGKVRREAKTMSIALLVSILDDAYDHPAWHGPNLRGAVRGVPAKQAVWRPKPKRHNIAEIVLHCAYWKYAVRRRLRGEKRGSFPLKGSNWFTLPQWLDDAAWRDHVRLLDDQHKALRETVATFPASKLSTIPAGCKVSNLKIIYGIAAHDVYHAGQVRLLKGLWKNK